MTIIVEIIVIVEMMMIRDDVEIDIHRIDCRWMITFTTICNAISTLSLFDRTLYDAGNEEQGMFHRN